MRTVFRGENKRGNFANLQEYREWKRKKEEAQRINKNPQGNVYAFPVVAVSEPKVCPRCGESTRESICPICGKDIELL